MGERWQAGLLGEAIVSRWLGFHGFEVSTTSSHEDRKGFDLVARRERQSPLSIQVKVDRKSSQTGRAYIPISRMRGTQEVPSWGHGVQAQILIVLDGVSWEGLVWRRETWKVVCDGLQPRNSQFGKYSTVDWEELSQTAEITIPSLEIERYVLQSGPDWPSLSPSILQPPPAPGPGELSVDDVIQAWGLNYKHAWVLHLLYEVHRGTESPELLAGLLGMLSASYRR